MNKVFFVLFLFGTKSFADGILSVAYEFGGDAIEKIQYDDGSTSKFKIGNGILLSGGGLFDISSNATIQATIGSKITQGIEGSADYFLFRRYMVEVIPFYNFSSVRIGAGITYHVSPEVTAANATANDKIKFGSTLGYVAQLDYHAKEVIAGLRYTTIQYKDQTDTYKADSVGIHLGARIK
jgi:hypothetical protein